MTSNRPVADPTFDRLQKAFLELMARQQEQPADAPELLVRLRTKALPDAGYAPPQVTVADAAAPGPHGPVPVRVYNASASRPDRPLFVWCHGGGFVGGDIDMPEADATAREVAARADAVVVSVDYRLATGGVHFPVPHDDVVAAFRWACGNASAFDASEGRVHLGGASAGANLAAGAALRLRDDDGPVPASVLLAYPMVHGELPPASEELASKLAPLPPVDVFQDHDVVQLITENFLGGPVSAASPYALPAIADLTRFPRTLIVNCEYDGLRASGEAFAEQLRAAGVVVEVLLAPDVLHGHLNSPHLAEAQQTYGDMASWLIA